VRRRADATGASGRITNVIVAIASARSVCARAQARRNADFLDGGTILNLARYRSFAADFGDEHASIHRQRHDARKAG
jgi:hypothetical protein